MASDRLPTILGFAGAGLVLGALVWFVGLDDVLATLSSARPPVLALVLLAAVVWLSAWGMALKTVLAAIGSPIPARTAVFLYAGAVFSNNVTPFGQAGGEPVSALLIAEGADSDYETGLAAIASVDALHFVPSIGFAAIGVVFVAAGRQLGRNLLAAAGAVGGLAVVVPLAAYLGWRYRYALENVVVRLFTPVVRSVARVLPSRSPPARAAIAERIESFFHAVERVATDRKRLALALGFSALGWLAMMASLWLSLYALDRAVPPEAILLVIPVGGLGAVMPLPGGSGAMETIVATLLVPTAGISFAVATSAVLLHRVATFWLPTLVGGGVVTMLGADRAAVEE